MGRENIITVEAEDDGVQGRGLALAGETDKIALATLRMHILQSQDIDDAMALFYSYGENSPSMFKEESFTKLLKDIYTHYHVDVPEKIEGLIGVNTERGYILKFLSETIPNLIQDGKIRKSIIDEIIKSDGILTGMMAEVEEKQQLLLREVSENFTVLKSIPGADKKNISNAESQMIGKVKGEFYSKLNRFKKVLEESDTRTLMNNVASLAEKFSGNEASIEVKSSLSGKDLEKIGKIVGKKSPKEMLTKLDIVIGKIGDIPKDNKSDEILSLLQNILDEEKKRGAKEKKQDKIDLTAIPGSPFENKKTSLEDILEVVTKTKDGIMEAQKTQYEGFQSKLAEVEEKASRERAQAKIAIGELTEAIEELGRKNERLTMILKDEIDESKNIREDNTSARLRKEVRQDV